MKIISKANAGVLKILARIKNEKTDRFLHYCVNEETEDGILLFNLLTRELVMLSEDEYSNIAESEYFGKHWFTVPEDANDKEYADLVKWILNTRKKKTSNITGYTIFTTTDCNARCYYCFELGRSRIPMSTDTAKKVAKYIKEHCGGEKVSLRWFGGEPLFNQTAIDTICNVLREENVEFSSSAVSNGYLFDMDTACKAKEKWNVKNVQITLDGTETVYNKTKAFIYRDGSAYQIVMKNIGHLLDAGISVQIRLNMDLRNAEDLLVLVDHLAEQFGGKKGLHVYAHHLFKGDMPLAETYTEEEWVKREASMQKLRAKIEECGLAAKQGITKNIRQNYCMADSGNSVTILPNGEIGLCEHYSESEFIGHIDEEHFDNTVIDSWKETIDEIPECAECFYYPMCIRLKKCSNASVCFHYDRQEKLMKTKKQMITEYLRWKENASDIEEVYEVEC